MNSSTLRYKITALLLGASLLASAATAADLREAVHPFSRQILARLAAFLDSLWPKDGASLLDGLNKGGGSLDPWGGEKEGGSLDLWGLDKEGPGLDPWGLCGQKECTGTTQASPSAIDGAAGDF